MPHFRPFAAFSHLRVALLFALMAMVAPAPLFAEQNADDAPLLSASAPPGQDGEEDIFAAPPARNLSGKTPLLTLLYNASTTGEAHPCPT